MAVKNSIGIGRMIIIALIGVVGGFLMINQIRFHQSQTLFQEKQLAHQKALIESRQQGDLVVLMSSILEKADRELNQNPKRQLSNETIERIADLSQSFKPYRIFKGDSLSKKRFSPERGQLLLALSKMNIDTMSLIQIMLKSSFERAELAKANLQNAFLKNIKLKDANLKEANLLDANLQNTDLKSANLWGANLNLANLQNSDLKRANLNWAELNQANLKKAILNGADLTNAKMRQVNLDSSSIKWANLTGVFLNDAILTNIIFFWSNLKRANLQNANFSNTDLRRTVLTEANLKGINLTNVRLDLVEFAEGNWFEKLSIAKVEGVDSIENQYKIVTHNSEQSNYRLEKIKD